MSMEKINVNLYGGKGLFGGRETPLEADEIYCDRACRCSFFGKGTCLRCRSLFAPSCKYGRNVVTKGYTSRAAKYYPFKKKYENDPVYEKLRYPDRRVGIIGDEIFMKLTFVSVRERTDKDDPWRKSYGKYIVDTTIFGCGTVFIPKKDLTNDLLFAVVTGKPRSLIGEVIKDYSEKVVPEILQEMRDICPDIYERFTGEFPEFIFAPNYIGKKVYVKSLRPGTFFQAKNTRWVYDGEFVVAQAFDLSFLSPWFPETRYGEAKIKATDDMVIEVQDNAIVTADTVFA